MGQLGAIIQARLGSTRLPGKTLMDIAGKSLLARVVDGVRVAIPNVYIVCPPEDKAIIRWARVHKIPYSLDRKPRDVLDSFYHCADEFGIDPIVRITADNPLIRPETIKKVVRYFGSGDYDWVANCRLKTTFPIGDDCEVMSFGTLARAWHEAKDAYDREHVTPYIYNHPDKFKVGVVVNSVNESGIRWTVDTQADLDWVRSLYANQE